MATNKQMLEWIKDMNEWKPFKKTQPFGLSIGGKGFTMSVHLQSASDGMFHTSVSFDEVAKRRLEMSMTKAGRDLYALACSTSLSMLMAYLSEISCSF